MDPDVTSEKEPMDASADLLQDSQTRVAGAAAMPVCAAAMTRYCPGASAVREATGPSLEKEANSESELDDELRALIARTAQHDERALERLYDLTFGKVYAVALRIMRNAEAAEEAVEDTYWQAWREAARYDPARGRALTWLLTICRSRALDALRRREPAEVTGDFESLQSEVAAENADPYDLLDAIERGSAIHAAIGKLKPRVRQLVALAFFRGLTHQEIADACNMPLGTVKVTLFRACQELKDCLSGQGLEPGHD
jgi:RNA polymerase sigma-70 factor, ECF subfamily